MLNSKQIRTANGNFVNEIVKYKNGSVPYYSSGPSAMTDTDVFPYTRFYRGQPKSDFPIVAEREAGWRPVRTACYNDPVIKRETDLYPNHCFQSAPSTVYPCYPEYLRKYSDKNALDLQLFRKSVNEYR
jgi:hypothetical protein